MKFSEAFKAMKEGAKVKLPSWGGYWFWDEGKQTIIMHCKDGRELDIRETERVEYTILNLLSDEWILADEKNCPQLGGEATFSFGEAIKYLKRGMKVARKGWNGKSQHIELATAISYKNPTRLATRPLPSAGLPACRWAGWHLRRTCLRRIGSSRNKGGETWNILLQSRRRSLR